MQTRSEDSLLYHANIINDMCMCRREVGEAVSYLEDRIQRHEDEQMSQPSRRSSRSVSSAGSQRAQADAARAELQFLEEESVLKKEALEIETNIETIKTERARQYIEEQRRIHLQP